MIYHVLPEVEPFSEAAGGALSRWVANTLRNEQGAVVCPWADATWGFENRRILARNGLLLYGKLLKRREFRLATAHRVRALRWLLQGLARRLEDHDVLYVHNRPEYLLALRPERARFKLVLHMHNDHLLNFSPEERAALAPDLAVFNSAFLEDQGRGLLPHVRRTAVLHNGADEDRFYPASQASDIRPPVILFVGRLVPEKGAHVLVSAMRLLRAQGTIARARIVGCAAFGDPRSSPYMDGLRAGAPDTVQFKPYLTGRALAEEFRKASIFCCPSTWDEPFGMVNVEAMASGLPVVATRVGGIPEVFADGGALLVDENSPSALAEGLHRLIADTALRRRLAREGYASYLRRFRWSVIASNYRQLMDGLHELPVSHIKPYQESALDDEVRTA